LTVAIDQKMANVTINCLITNILQDNSLLCSVEVRNSNRFGTTWGWV